MDYAEFRRRVNAYRRPTARTQAQLAKAIGLHPHVLSHKLNGTDGSHLTHVEIKDIIRILASWQSFTSSAEVLELLALMDLGPAAFSVVEWSLPPLLSLSDDGSRGAAAASAAKGPMVARSMPDTDMLRYAPLVAPTTPLIGRSGDIASVRALLVGDARLVTLTGVGGIGKTRLALAVATDLRDSRVFVDGVVFVGLAATDSAAMVPVTIAHAFGLTDAGTKVVDRIISLLRPRTLVLVLDNFEGVLDAAIMVGELLAACPGLRVLTTSRKILRIYGEFEYRVSPLEVPSNRGQVTSFALKQYSAVNLFMQRARAAGRDVVVDAATGPAIVEICRRLDGLPLAIELVAAQVRHRSPAALLNRLKEGRGVLELGVQGPRDLPFRQRALRDTIAWSYRLLSPDEQVLFRQLAVFSGGWSADAADAVGGNAAGASALVALVDHNLVWATEGDGDETRFGMLETIRAYAWEQLGANPEEVAAARRAHAEYFVHLVDRIHPWAAENDWIQDRHQLDRLERELDNLREALTWAQETDQVIVGLRLAIQLQRFWESRGSLREGAHWLEALLAVPSVDPGEEERVVRAAALRAIAHLAVPLGELHRARARSDESLALYATTNDGVGRARAFRTLGTVLSGTGDVLGARDAYLASVETAREFGAVSLMASASINLAETLLLFGDLAGARALGEAALVEFERLAQPSGIARSQSALAEVAATAGDFARALDLEELALARWRDLGVRRHVGNSARRVGWIAAVVGDVGRAVPLLQESLDLFQASGDALGIAAVRNGFAMLATRQGEYRQAGLLFADYVRFSWEHRFDRNLGNGLIEVGAVQVYLASPGLDRLPNGISDLAGWLLVTPIRPGAKDAAARGVRHIARGLALLDFLSATIAPEHRETRDRTFAAARVILGHDAFEAAYAEGFTMPLDLAVAEVVNLFLKAETRDNPESAKLTARTEAIGSSFLD